MENTYIREIDEWIRPWDKEKTDNLYERDERFFALIMKGVLAFLNKNIILNGKPIQHFVFNTGSSYMYLENNGYEFSMCETSGEDQMYMKMPRCVCNFGDISVPMEELTSQYVRGIYERVSSLTGKMKSYSAELRRLPLEISLSLQYILSTTNESLILMQELIDKIIFQRYFNIIYLGQRIKCSIEFPQNMKFEFNKIDMASPETKQKTINLELKICTNYPIINLETELDGNAVIGSFSSNLQIEKSNLKMDNENKKYE